ncbi:doublesex- and mab-3-related transcription factor DM-W-like [Panonychus citri]|uniref:doublesex- and mab-3-related transcription factor DM-W-like n=1 Tax=Panonychus citri TaxID=50023 RepID=UPI002307F46E|nr:doublesex- and mab-3-related transcription factor DM-W-like [Panonychus citri]XP_053203584.1 doublesex- and mab-3-related transcription factor DM-W-like [Panonychus citri]XP_053204076.1 doublesex- and mab-3-related transcription factor DM-W-like [Panonychus citri]
MNDEKKKKREPNCAICLNHGIKVLLKGHKRHCKHRDCKCRKCIETKERQEYMADMQYIKRNGNAEEARLGKKADMIAIYNERMKNKKSKKTVLETECDKLTTHMAELGDEVRSKSPVDKSIPHEVVDSNIQDLLHFFREELRLTEEDDMLFHSLVVMVQDLEEATNDSVYDNIIEIYKKSERKLNFH